MIVPIDRQDAAALVLHMRTMRQSFRNLLKKKYKSEQKEHLAAFDYVVKESTELLVNEDQKHKDLHLNINELRVLEEFLRAYVAKTEKEMTEAMTDDYKQHMQLLSNIQAFCRELIDNVPIS